jgi:hypothetical protein
MTGEQNPEIYNKIKEIYNTDKGKGFIKHLINAFIPVNPIEFYLNGDDKYDAITQKRGFSVKVYHEMTFETLFIRAEIELAKTEDKKLYYQKQLAEIFDNVRTYFNLEKGEDLSSRKMYYSEKSDKTLTYQTIKQLQLFALNNNLIHAYIPKNENFILSKKGKEALTNHYISMGQSVVEGNENAFEKLKKMFNQ